MQNISPEEYMYMAINDVKSQINAFAANPGSVEHRLATLEAKVEELEGLLKTFAEMVF